MLELQIKKVSLIYLAYTHIYIDDYSPLLLIEQAAATAAGLHQQMFPALILATISCIHELFFFIRFICGLFT